MTALDENKDGDLTRTEVSRSFKGWFKSWDTDSKGVLDQEKLQSGLNRALGGPGGPGGPGGGPRPGN